MNRADFTAKIVEPTFEAVRALNQNKGRDYSGDADALSNFKRHATSLGLTPEQVLYVYLAKHWDAITSYVKNGQVESEPVDGRIDDAITYLLLLKGLVSEQA
jgi:hypothetical protein